MREILAAGYAAQPPPPASSPGSLVRRKQSQAKNLLDVLMARAEQVLALLDDLRTPIGASEEPQMPLLES